MLVGGTMPWIRRFTGDQLTPVVAFGVIMIAAMIPTRAVTACDDKLHSYFATADRVTMPPDCSQAVMVDGSVIPERFTLRVSSNREVRSRFTVAPLEFVLLRPQVVEIDGIGFAVDKPIYIATTELSNAQAAVLSGADVAKDGYDLFVRHELEAVASTWLLDNWYEEIEDFRNWSKDHPPPTGEPDGANDILLHVIAYLVDLDKPVLVMDLERAAHAARLLESSSQMFVRLPGLAEWFTAMRAGARTKYWWGDEADLATVTVSDSGPMKPFPMYLSDIRDVTEGKSNALGLLHVLGNAEEIAFPSTMERMILRQHFGTHATRPGTSGDRRRERYNMQSTTWVRMGGSVRASTDRFLNQALSLEGIIASQDVDCPGFGYTGNLTGVRFVIDLPVGEITFGKPNGH